MNPVLEPSETVKSHQENVLEAEDELNSSRSLHLPCNLCTVALREAVISATVT